MYVLNSFEIVKKYKSAPDLLLFIGFFIGLKLHDVQKTSYLVLQLFEARFSDLVLRVRLPEVYSVMPRFIWIG